MPGCSTSCGWGTRIKSREVLREASCGGKDCDGPYAEKETCKIEECKSATTTTTPTTSQGIANLINWSRIQTLF